MLPTLSTVSVFSLFCFFSCGVWTISPLKRVFLLLLLLLLEDENPVLFVLLRLDGDDEEEALALVIARFVLRITVGNKKATDTRGTFGAQSVRCRWKKTLVVVPSIERTALLIVGVPVRRSLIANDGDVKENNAR